MGLNIIPPTACVENSTTIIAASSNIAAMTTNLTGLIASVGTSASTAATNASLHGKASYLIANPLAVRLVQRGVFASTSATTTVSLTSVVTAKTMVNPLGITATTAATEFQYRLTLTDSTTLTLTKTQAAQTHSVGWEVVEFY